MSWIDLPTDLLYYQLELPYQAALVCPQWSGIPISEYQWHGSSSLAMRARKLILTEISDEQLPEIQRVLKHNPFLRRLKLSIPEIIPFLSITRIQQLTLVGINPILPSKTKFKKLYYRRS